MTRRLRFALPALFVMCWASAAPSQAQTVRGAAPALTLEYTGTALAQDIRAGGPDRVSAAGSGCSGFVAHAAPAAAVRVVSGGTFSIYATSPTDLTLVVADPAGRMRCSDDASGTNPALTYARAEPGIYHVWVGTFSAAAAGAPARLNVGPGAPRW